MNPSEVQPFSHARIGPARWVLGLIAGMLGAILLAIIVVWIFAGVGLVELGRMVRGGSLHIGVDQPTVIRQVRALQRLETVSYTMDKIVTGERDNPILPQPLAGDRLLLMVHGEVVAGLDLSKLAQGDVTVHGRDVSISLPKAEVFATHLDNGKTKVYSRDTGLFSSPDPNLETQVRAEAERQLQAAALQDGILKTADQNARQTLTSLLTGLGFASVEIR